MRWFDPTPRIATPMNTAKNVYNRDLFRSCYRFLYASVKHRESLRFARAFVRWHNSLAPPPKICNMWNFLLCCSLSETRNSWCNSGLATGCLRDLDLSPFVQVALFTCLRRFCRIDEPKSSIQSVISKTSYDCSLPLFFPDSIIHFRVDDVRCTTKAVTCEPLTP